MTTLLTAVTHRHEADFVALIDGAHGVTLVRRCADLAELLSVGAAGVAEVAVISPDLRGIDRDALRSLAAHGVRPAGLVASGDEAGERRLRQLGVRTILHPDADSDDIVASLTALAEGAAMVTEELDEQALWSDDRDDRDGSPWAPPDASLDEVVRAPVTVVWGPTGSPGRTTVAVTLAAQLAASSVRTLLIDADTWSASIAQVLGIVDEAPGVAAAARASEQGNLDVPALARVAPEVLPGLRVVTGLPRPDRWPEIRAAALEDILRVARMLAEHVVVDIAAPIEDDEELSYDTQAPRRNAAALAALAASDHLIVVGAADPVGLQRLVRAVQDVSVVPSAPPTVVVNKVRASAVGAHPERVITQVLGRFAGLENIRFLPWAPHECDDALLAGRALTETHPKAALTEAIGELAALVDPRAAPVTRAGGGRRRHTGRVRSRR